MRDCGTKSVINVLLPLKEAIPQEFWNYNPDNKWVTVAERWRYSGLPRGAVFVPKEGIDVGIAKMHLAAVLASWVPVQEHQIAGCAYLMSLWFDEVTFPDEPRPDSSGAEVPRRFSKCP